MIGIAIILAVLTLIVLAGFRCSLDKQDTTNRHLARIANHLCPPLPGSIEVGDAIK